MLTAVYVVPLITAVSPTVALAHLQIPPSKAILFVVVFPLVLAPPAAIPSSLEQDTVDEINSIWLKTQKESFGESIKISGDYKYFWAYIPHFIHSPFYVYAYAFGDCLVNSLFNTYEKGLTNFDDKYINLLKSGGSKKYDELFSPFNLNLSKKSFFSKLGTAIAGKSKVDEIVLDELEEVLIRSDVGVATTIKIIQALENRVAKDKFLGTKELGQILRDEITSILKHEQQEVVEPFESELPNKPHVIMVVGVNGVGKTTTIGKLSYHFKRAGKKVILGAADTFRAGAIDQLQIWADRVGVPLVKQQMGSDPASVAFDTLESAVAQKSDLVIIDTAGRLHNKINLMNELSKVKKVMDRVISDAPHEVLLVLDGSTGQNAFEQAKQFTASTDVSSLAITKLDGTAKGGVVMGISDQFRIPVKYIGVGEALEDLQLFHADSFVETFFS